MPYTFQCHSCSGPGKVCLHPKKMLPENVRFSSSSCKEEPIIANLHFKPCNLCQPEEQHGIKLQSTQCCQLVFKLIYDRWAEFVSSQCLHCNRHVTAPPGHSRCSVLRSVSPECQKETLIAMALIVSPYCHHCGDLPSTSRAAADLSLMPVLSVRQ